MILIDHRDASEIIFNTLYEYIIYARKGIKMRDDADKIKICEER